MTSKVTDVPLAVVDLYQRLAVCHPALPVDLQWRFARFGLSVKSGVPVLGALMARSDLDPEVEQFIWKKDASVPVVTAWLSRPGLSHDLIRRLALAESRKTVLRQLAAVPGLPDEVYVRACSAGKVTASSSRATATSHVDAALAVLEHADVNSVGGRAALDVLSEARESLLYLLPRTKAAVIRDLVGKHANVCADLVTDETSVAVVYRLLRSTLLDPDLAEKVERRVLALGWQSVNKAAGLSTDDLASRTLDRQMSVWLLAVWSALARNRTLTPDLLDDWSSLVHSVLSMVEKGVIVPLDPGLAVRKRYSSGRAAPSPAEWVNHLRAWLDGPLNGKELSAAMGGIRAARTLPELAAAAKVLSGTSLSAAVESRFLELLANPKIAESAASAHPMPPLSERAFERALDVGVKLAGDGHFHAALALSAFVKYWQKGQAQTLMSYAVRLADAAGRDVADVLGDMYPFLDCSVGDSYRHAAFQRLLRLAVDAGVDWRRMVLAVPPDAFASVLTAGHEVGPGIAELFVDRMSSDMWDVLAQLWPVMSLSTDDVLTTAQALAANPAAPDGSVDPTG